MKHLTHDRLKALLTYDPATGVFQRDGATAGSVDRQGYWRVKIDGVDYLGHQLAWLYMTGQWSKSRINHRNDDRADNRWANLREASAAQTARNRRTRNKLGVKGVKITAYGNYAACIFVNKKSRYLGTFPTAEAAGAAYANAAIAHFGDFARVTP